jgi:hypothetical protein
MHFVDIDDVRSNITTDLKAIPQNQFQNYFEGSTKSWHWWIASKWRYSEGDNSDIQQ